MRPLPKIHTTGARIDSDSERVSYQSRPSVARQIRYSNPSALPLWTGRCHDDGIDADADGIGDRCDDCVGDGCGLTVTVADPGIAGQDNTWTLSGAPAGVEAIWLRGRSLGAALATGPKCAGVELGIQQVKSIGTSVTDADGRSQLVLNVPAVADEDAMNVQVLLPGSCTVSNVSTTAFP